MKKIMLIVIILGWVIIGNAQVDKNAILERLRTELLPQTKDYNPYQYNRENFIIACLELRTEIEQDECDDVKELIERFYNNDTRFPYKNSVDYISHISRFRCQEAYNFLETQIKNNPSEIVRYYAIILLAWSLESAHLPCLLEYAKKESLSVQEKLALGGAFTIYGVYTSNSELKEKAIRLLDEICYDPSLNIYEHCDANYLKLGGKAAVNFYTSWIEQHEGFRKVTTAVVLAELGEYEKTYPIFVEAIHSEIPNNIYEAIRGLAIIGTKEAIRLIEAQSQNKNEQIAKYAKETLKNLDMKGDKK